MTCETMSEGRVDPITAFSDIQGMKSTASASLFLAEQEVDPNIGAGDILTLTMTSSSP